MTVQERLVEYRKRTGYSMAKIEAMTGIPADRLYKWEKGTKPSTGEDLQQLERLFANVLETKKEITL